jgi:type VI secretion system protein ImpA
MTETVREPAIAGIELEPLLAPIAGDNPAGEWLRFDPLYDEIRRLREEDDAALPQGVWERPLKRADWRAVADRCTGALTDRSKDLQLAVWTAEAWLHLHAFPGLEQGLRLISALCREYWEHLYPPADGGNVEPRVAPIVWMAEKLVLPLKRVPITHPSGEDEVPYGWIDSELALYQANLAKSKGSAVPPAKPNERAVVTHPKFLVSVSLTPAPWYAQLGGEVGALLGAIHELEDVLMQLAGEAAAPSLTSLRTPVQQIHSFIGRVLTERVQSGELPEWVLSEAAQPFEQDSSQELTGPPFSGPIASRAEAFQHLREASEYLMRTEPHSPVPYLVRRAVSWEHLSLAELLEELMSRNADLPSIYALLGIRK